MSRSDTSSSTETTPSDTVLIVGGGPVGLICATTLAHYGVKSVLLERNHTTTRWPKMDLTIARSMEIFRTLGIADKLRAKGVPSHFPFTCLFSSGLNSEKAITSWKLPSVDEFKSQITERNDGTLPLEPWQRVSQEVFESWLKDLADENPLIDVRFGTKVKSACELETGAKIVAIDTTTGAEKEIFSRFAVGCDGANSVLRTSLGIELEGGPVPAVVLLVHFKSSDLSRIQKQGQFWHIFFHNSVADGGAVKGAIIAQDEVDIWTVHRFLPAGFDDSVISSEEAVYSVLGGMGEPFPIKIDEILVRSTSTPRIAVAKTYAGPKQKILLAGDACHQTVPTGGYGMNMGIAEAFDLGWKLSAVINGWGGPELLPSYEADRRPVAQLSVEWSKTHMVKLVSLPAAVNLDASIINVEDESGGRMRSAMREYAEANDGHNKSIGVEMGYRYESGINILNDIDKESPPPEFDARKYIPTTYPGYRAPHVFLKDGSPIFDKFSKGYTLIEFDRGRETSVPGFFQAAAKQRNVPLEVVSLAGEDHAQKIWGTTLALIRPDGFVSWHGNSVLDQESAYFIISKAAGFAESAVTQNHTT